MPEHKIIHETGEKSGRYVIHLSSDTEAEMTYRHTGPKTISIDHTFVPPRFRGQNIAQRLVEQAIKDAKRDSTKIVPLCSYVSLQFRRHPAWNDVLAPSD